MDKRKALTSIYRDSPHFGEQKESLLVYIVLYSILGGSPRFGGRQKQSLLVYIVFPSIRGGSPRHGEQKETLVQLCRPLQEILHTLANSCADHLPNPIHHILANNKKTTGTEEPW